MIGIYKITNPSGRVYIGQSINIEHRFKEYRRLKCKLQKRLINSFTKYAVENHIFDIIEECAIQDLNTRERYWQDEYNVLDKYKGLNCKLTTSLDKSGKYSEELKQKIGLGNKGKIVSEKTRLKISLANKGNQIWLGRKHTEETKKKMSQSAKIKIFTEIHRLNLSKARVRRVVSEDTKQLISTALKGRRPPAKTIEASRLVTTKIILDLETGIYYEGRKAASDAKNINFFTLRGQLTGKHKSKTSLVYV